jgi:uncharacterized beta-barrel protein YwiB (DUF1934 family)
MTEDILVSVKGLHTLESEGEDEIEVFSAGKYYLKNGKHYIVYDEILDGLEGSLKSTIKFTEKQVELIRNGAASARMLFQPGQEHMVIYQTPMGPLSISLYTEDMEISVEEEKISLRIDYSLKTEDVVVSESTVNISICPKELARF